VADLDGDGDRDLLFVSEPEGAMHWHEATGDGWARHALTVLPGGNRSVAAADLDGDGDADVVTVSTDGEISWHENTEGDASDWQSHGVPLRVAKTMTIHVADVDGDGDPDLISAAREGERIAWFENLDGQGLFGNPMTVNAADLEPFPLAAEDRDGDGAADTLNALLDPTISVAWTQDARDSSTTIAAVEVRIADLTHSFAEEHLWDVPADAGSGVLTIGPDRIPLLGTLSLEGAAGFLQASDRLGRTLLIVEMPRAAAFGNGDVIRLTHIADTTTGSDESHDLDVRAGSPDVEMGPSEPSPGVLLLGGCQDVDGDGYGDPGDPSCPAGGAADCNDSYGATYPGAPEQNDGVDNQCPGDEGYGDIDELSGTVEVDDAEICWSPQQDATLYEVARSDDAQHFDGCLLDNTFDTCLADSDQPPPGEAFYYLVRSAAGHLGSWGTSSAGVIRDTVCPACVVTDEPDDAFIDANCDGVDGDVDEAIFVATTGIDSPICGTTQNDPCGTINYALSRVLAPRDALYVQAGSYDEVVDLAEGVHIYGGYDDAWLRQDRNVAGHAVFITGGLHPIENQFMTVRAEGLGQPTVLADLFLQGPNASGSTSAGTRSSYVVFARNSDGLELRHVDLYAGNGAAGTTGAAGQGASQSQAPDGSDGGNATGSATCSTSRVAGGSGAGNPSCSNTTGGSGGRGGKKDTNCGVCGCVLCGNCNATSGISGGNGSQTQGANGQGGNGGSPCNYAGSGSTGRTGNYGTGGAGGTGWFVVADFWYADAGTAGLAGGSGGGGGGGGGSGGCDTGVDARGAGGGGGGAGGCGAPSGGGAGTGGGGSFGIFAVSSSISAIDCTIVRGDGGPGGRGGIGANGQWGGYGGDGGNGLRGAKYGAYGGTGGRGGYSGGGGGGAGGSSYATWSSGSVVSYDCAVVGGSGGNGGTGGTSAGHNGTTADPGTVGIDFP